MLNQPMSQQEINAAAEYILEHIQDEESIVSQAIAWGAFQMLGRLFRHQDVYKALDKAQESGHELRNPIRMLVR